MTAAAPPIIVAGHICLDIRPQLPDAPLGPAGWSVAPGSLIGIGPAAVNGGGCVSNVGMALHRLGASVGLMGKVGDDLFSGALLDLLRRQDPALADDMIRSPQEPTSYSIIIEPPGADRAFLHCTGANHTFRARDVDLARVADARLFHFGYPPVLPAMCDNDGGELVKLFTDVRQLGVLTSLDLCTVDPHGPAGKVDWPTLLRNVLPHVDLFCPSLDELLYMTDRTRFDALQADPVAAQGQWGGWLDEVSGRCLDWGAGVVAIKLGDQGLYLHGGDAPRLERWAGARRYHPCFEVDVAGATGAGDCTIAGLLTGAVRGLDSAAAVRLATAGGACSAESADATSGVPELARVQERLAAGWPTRRPTPSLADLWLDPTHAAEEPPDAGHSRAATRPRTRRA